MGNITVLLDACVANGVGPITFDDPQLAWAFIKAVFGLESMEYFLGVFRAVLPTASEQMITGAVKVVSACMGKPI